MKIKFEYKFDNVHGPTTVLFDDVKSVIIGYGALDIVRDGYFEESYMLNRTDKIIIWENEE